MKAAAQSPGHVTGFFAIFPNGSTGAGLSVDGGMRTTAWIVPRASRDSFSLNGRKQKLVVSGKVLELFRNKTKTLPGTKVAVSHSTKFPIGYGLGISGAGALSLSIALNRLFRTRLSKAEVLGIAKRAEIECGTGLGDVVGEQFSGVMMGKRPYPSRAIAHIPHREKYVVFGFFRPIVTKKIIRSTSRKRKINKAGLECMARIEEKKTMARFIEMSRAFTLASGLATRKIKKVMAAMPEASMSMLGETIFIPTNNPERDERRLKKFCRRTMVARIATKGAGPL